MSPLRSAGVILLLSAGIAGIGIAVQSAQPPDAVTVIYPATGLIFAAIWNLGRRFLAVSLLAQFTLSYVASRSLAVASFVSITELVVCALLYLVLTRYEVRRDLTRFRDVTVFVGAALLVTAIGGLAAGSGEMLLEPHKVRPVLYDALSFWLSDFVSILIFVPLLTTWRRWPFRSSLQFRGWLYLSLLLVILGGGIALMGGSAATALFLLLPLVVFTSIVSGVAGAASSGAILLGVLLVQQRSGAPLGFEPLIRTLYVGIATATGYLLGVLWSEKEQALTRLRYRARNDGLTGLANRFELESQLSEAVGKPYQSALLYLDLDQFKLVNDTCGHVAGDRMLQELSAELRKAAPENAIFARLGGDEFACILEDTLESSVLETADALRQTVTRYRFVVNKMSFGVGVSIGVTFFPTLEGDTADAVFGRADVACYRAKEDGRNRVHVYRAGDEKMLQWHSGIQKASQLDQALSSGQFRLYSQPIVDLQSPDGSPWMHEVLLRLVSGDEIRSPGEFLPIAERFGLMGQIDRWVLDTACSYLGRTGDSKLCLSINVSGSTLGEPAYFEQLVTAPGRHGIRPSQICIEVTESVMIHRLQEAVEAMRSLSALGFTFALDDFGAGVASFAYLQELPVSLVKIDGRIVRDLVTDPASEVIISALVRLAKMRGIECVAEWVESEEILERLRTLGVRYAQGYHLSLPSELVS